MKLLNIVIGLLLITTASFAEQDTVTGRDYLELSKRQRVRIVSNFKKEAGRLGVTIRQGPIHYCKMLDKFYKKHPEHKKEALGMVLKTLMIMEYDWAEKGVDKDELARKWLGDDLYNANKANKKNLR